jgi:hypothetical protein
VRYALGAEQTQILESKSWPRRPDKVTPKGTTHAVPVGASESVCGMTGLHVFDEDWEQANFTEKCSRCRELTSE